MMANLECDSSDPTVAALRAVHTAGLGGPAAIIGESEGRGVLGLSGPGQGVWGQSDESTGLVGISTRGFGTSGQSEESHGVVGISKKNYGVYGQSEAAGVVGESTTWMGVFGQSHSTTGGHGVMGRADAAGAGVVGESTKGIGVFGTTATGPAAIKGEHTGGGLAGHFQGDVLVSHDIKVNGDVQLTGADVAEDFGLVGDLVAEPGCVVVLAGEDEVCVSEQPYDRKVAGVVSGAGSYRPALVLDRREDATRRPLALTGKVWCKVDADTAPIRLGDLLTTSSTPGHAMRAADESRAFGAVIGKALGTLDSGRGLLPVLVALQ